MIIRLGMYAYNRRSGPCPENENLVWQRGVQVSPMYYNRSDHSGQQNIRKREDSFELQSPYGHPRRPAAF